MCCLPSAACLLDLSCAYPNTQLPTTLATPATLPPPRVTSAPPQGLAASCHYCPPLPHPQPAEHYTCTTGPPDDERPSLELTPQKPDLARGGDASCSADGQALPRKRVPDCNGTTNHVVADGHWENGQEEDWGLLPDGEAPHSDSSAWNSGVQAQVRGIDCTGRGRTRWWHQRLAEQCGLCNLACGASWAAEGNIPLPCTSRMKLRCAYS